MSNEKPNPLKSALTDSEAWVAFAASYRPHRDQSGQADLAAEYADQLLELFRDRFVPRRESALPIPLPGEWNWIDETDDDGPNHHAVGGGMDLFAFPVNGVFTWQVFVADDQMEVAKYQGTGVTLDSAMASAELAALAVRP